MVWTKIVVQLGARPARTDIGHLPEVVLVAQPEDPVLRQAHVLGPQVRGLVIRVVHRDEEAVRIDPFDHRCHLVLAEAVAEVHPAAALEPIAEAVRLAPDSAATHAAYGRIARLAGQDALAERELRKALEIDPSYANAHLNLGVLRKEQGHAVEALASLKVETFVSPIPSLFVSKTGSTAPLLSLSSPPLLARYASATRRPDSAASNAMRERKSLPEMRCSNSTVRAV